MSSAWSVTDFSGIGIEEDWLDPILHKLPLFVIMASGRSTFNSDSAGVNAKLIPQVSPDEVVKVWLQREALPHVLETPIHHILPWHSSLLTGTGKCYVAFIRGPMKGEVRTVETIIADHVWVKELKPADQRKEYTEHSKYDVILSGAPIISFYFPFGFVYFYFI